MGKLAERYQDHARSGVYRVTSAEIPLRAASEANARVIELGAKDMQALEDSLRLLIEQCDRRPHIIVVGESVPLSKMHALARHCRDNALPFFALRIDPSGILDLPTLYKEPSA